MARLIRHSVLFILTLALLLTAAGVLSDKLKCPVTWERTAQNELTVHIASRTVCLDLDRMQSIAQKSAEIWSHVKCHIPGWFQNACTSVKNAFESFRTTVFGTSPNTDGILPPYNCKNADLAVRFTNASDCAIMYA